MRVIIDLTEDQIETLKAIGEEKQQSVAGLIRQAVSVFIQQHALNISESTFGISKKSPIAPTLAE